MKDYSPRINPIRPVPTNVPAAFETGRHAHLAGSLDDFEAFEAGESQLREYWKLVIKHRLLIGCAVLVSALVSLLYAFTVSPRYTAETKIRIGTYEPVLSATKIEDMLQEKSKETNYLETQIQEITSFSLADKVLLDPKVRAQLFTKGTQGFFGKLLGGGKDLDDAPESLDETSGYKSSIGMIKGYLAAINVKPIRRTSLVAIEVTLQDPQLAALVANKHALSYIDWVRQNRIDQQSRGLTFLRSQSEELRTKVADLEREMADYAESNSIVALNKDENITVQKMSQLNKLLTDATAKRIEAENAFNEGLASLDKNAAGYDDASVLAMRAELGKLEAERDQLAAKFTSSYPRMQQINSQVARLRESVRNQREQITSGLKAKMFAAQQEEKNLREELDKQKSQAFELSKREVQYNIMNRELTTSRELLENVLKQIKETSLAVESNASNVSVVDFAVVPRVPSYPNKKLMLMLGTLFGLFIGLAAAFVLSYLDNTLRTPEDVSGTLRLPSLGVVPSFALENLNPNPTAPVSNERLAYERARDARLNDLMVSEGDEAARGLTTIQNPLADVPVVYLSHPKSLAAEAYRTIRTGILLSQAGEPPRTILVTSAQSSEGKTTSSVNLAASLASAGGKVVIIDADLRRPSVHKHFKLPSNLPGVVDIITGQRDFSEVVIADILKRVSVIPAGKIPPNPAELLGSIEMANMLDFLASKFDYVIIDSPPILPVTDSVILSRYVDGVVMVVKGASTPKKVALDARDRLKAVGARVLGVILNDVDVTGGDYYYYNRYYHSYYQADEKKEGRAA